MLLKSVVAAKAVCHLDPPSRKNWILPWGEQLADSLWPQCLRDPLQPPCQAHALPGQPLAMTEHGGDANFHPFCPMWKCSWVLLVLELRIGLTAFSKLPRNLRLFPPSPSFAPSFHRCQTCMAIWSLPCPSCILSPFVLYRYYSNNLLHF